jgi:thiamine kinase-like enzyme
MIPENKQAAVKKALHTAFDIHELESIQQLTKGLSSALIFKITVRNKPYLLRVITRTDAMADPTYYFARMKAGAEAALAPHIYYLSIEDRISITGFIEEQPFSIAEAREKMAHSIQQLHALPKFPFRFHYFNKMVDFIAQFRASNILPESTTKDIFKLYACITSVYPVNDQENWVACHNDLKPENIVFDGRRPWLVDWEAASLNDRYLDLTVVANFVVKNAKDEADYLKSYFGEAVDEYKHARFFLMRQILHVNYFTLFMLFGTTGKPVDISSIDKPGFRVFHDRIWNGEISLASNEARQQYAWAHMEQVLHNMQTKRFDDSLRVVAEYSKTH